MTNVFISYSHQDEDWKDRVVRQLAVLATEGMTGGTGSNRLLPDATWPYC